jgi:ParB-like chromosome segregation protein Spo0J
MMLRSELRPADYNPRDMSKQERDKLDTVLDELGLLETLVHNKRTGNLVGGHQRLRKLDKDARRAGLKDYMVPVAVVDLSEAKEREANIALNNPLAMGQYDPDKLWELLGFEGLNVEGTGFDVADVYKMFGVSPFGEENREKLAEVNDRIREAAERYEGITRDRVAKRDSHHFYSVVVFKNDDERQAFTDALGLDDNRYIDGRLLRRLLTAKDDDPATAGLPPSEEGPR